MDDRSHQLLTQRAAAKIAGVSERVIREWIRAGLLRTTTLPGSSRKRIRHATLIAFLEELEED